jgi:hypothetical protein
MLISLITSMITPSPEKPSRIIVAGRSKERLINTCPIEPLMHKLKCCFCRIQNKSRPKRLSEKERNSSVEARDAPKDGSMKIGRRLSMHQNLNNSRLMSREEKT